VLKIVKSFQYQRPGRPPRRNFHNCEKTALECSQPFRDIAARRIGTVEDGIGGELDRAAERQDEDHGGNEADQELQPGDPPSEGEQDLRPAQLTRATALRDRQVGLRGRREAGIHPKRALDPAGKVVAVGRKPVVGDFHRIASRKCFDGWREIGWPRHDGAVDQNGDHPDVALER